MRGAHRGSELVDEVIHGWITLPGIAEASRIAASWAAAPATPALNASAAGR